jgi:hypothetical protein
MLVGNNHEFRPRLTSLARKKNRKPGSGKPSANDNLRGRASSRNAHISWVF